MGDSYHYCAEYCCQACVCVDCDGGGSVKGICESDNELSWNRLVEHGTTHFEIVNCCFEDDEDNSCRFPKEYKILCKDTTTCCNGGTTDAPDLCSTCGKWQCVWCHAGMRLNRCQICGERECVQCSMDVYFCDTCEMCDCPMCSLVRECEDGWEPEETRDGDKYAVWHCSDCYLEEHPRSTASEK